MFTKEREEKCVILFKFLKAGKEIRRQQTLNGFNMNT